MGKIISFLWIFTPVSSTVSVIIVWVAMTTSDWIRTQERILNYHYNGSSDNKYILKMTYSGIWEICAVTDGNTNISCKVIEYFSSEPYYMDLGDSSVAIPYAVKQSAFFFIGASLVQLFGEFGYLYGHYIKDRKVFVFIGGTIFIVSGLVMLIGIVTYISVFKNEISSKMKMNSPSHSTFNFQYGISFVLYVSGFICVEVSGTCAVLLFIQQDQTVQSVHFIQSSPIVYHNNYNTATNPGMMYPCRMHSEFCVGMDTLPANNLFYPNSHRESEEINRSCYLDAENSPPYGPASRILEYDDYGYNYDKEDRSPVTINSVATQTVSTIFNPRSMNDVSSCGNSYYSSNKDLTIFKMNKMRRVSSADKMDLLRKSTLV